MQVLERDIPPEIESLYRDVVALRPESGLKFQLYVPPRGLDIAAVHVGDYSGDSEIRLVADYDWSSLTHALLHALLHRKGYPGASTVATSDPAYASIAQILGCCVSHGALAAEVAQRPDLAPHWQRELAKYPEAAVAKGDRLSLLDTWRLADAHAEGLTDTAVAQSWQEQQESQAATLAKLMEARERCRVPNAMRWFHSMADLLRHYDSVHAHESPGTLAPSRAVLLSLVVTEPQLSRAADRVVEVVPLERDIVGFQHKQEKVLFHIRFALPGKQRREIAELRTALRSRTEDFLNSYWVPYTVDLRVGARD